MRRQRKSRHWRRALFAATAWCALVLFGLAVLHDLAPFDDYQHYRHNHAPACPDSTDDSENCDSDCGLCVLLGVPALAPASPLLLSPCADLSHSPIPLATAIRSVNEWRPGSQRDPPHTSLA